MVMVVMVGSKTVRRFIASFKTRSGCHAIDQIKDVTCRVFFSLKLEMLNVRFGEPEQQSGEQLYLQPH